MTAPRTFLRLQQHINPSTQARRTYSSSNGSPFFNIDALRTAMVARPEKCTYDFLSPTPTHLLNVALADFLPASCHPSHFNPSDPACYKLPPSNRDNRLYLPEAHHLVYFPPQLPASGLLPDGTDPFHSPGDSFTRRMWAGGSIRFDSDMEIRKQSIVCRESIGDVRIKGGPGEEKIFVDVWRKYGFSGEKHEAAAITERRSLVFMKERGGEEAQRIATEDALKKEARVVRAPHPPTFKHTLTPTPTLLFHYSALTFNAHQIHLNPEYCRRIEGHRNLLFHGPLSLTLMVSILRSQLGGAKERIKHIDYRNLAPLYAEEPLTVCVRPNGNDAHRAAGEKKWDVWVENSNGGLSVKGTAISVSKE